MIISAQCQRDKTETGKSTIPFMISYASNSVETLKRKIMASQFLKLFLFNCTIFIFIGTATAVPSPVNEGRITGGTVARAREFPFTVSLRTNDLEGLGHFCSGAILSPSLVLTAGACTDPLSPQIHEIVAGTLNRTGNFPGQQIRAPAYIVPHPGYIFPPHDDLSLIFLNVPFSFTENISAIALPYQNQTTYPNPVVMNGWGSEQYGLPMSDVLMRVTLDTYSDDYCASFMNETVPQNLLCAGVNEGGIGACQGDAGSPVTTTNGQIYLAGIGSHFGCTDPQCCGFPGPMEHTPEISYYLDWIKENSRKYGGEL